MKSLINILNLDKDQIRFLLQNHKFFSSDEIKLAAKMKVKNDKAADYERVTNAMRARDENSQLAAHQRRMTAYACGYNQAGLANALGFDGFGSQF